MEGRAGQPLDMQENLDQVLGYGSCRQGGWKALSCFVAWADKGLGLSSGVGSEVEKGEEAIHISSQQTCCQGRFWGAGDERPPVFHPIGTPVASSDQENKDMLERAKAYPSGPTSTLGHCEGYLELI